MPSCRAQVGALLRGPQLDRFRATYELVEAVEEGPARVVLSGGLRVPYIDTGWAPAVGDQCIMLFDGRRRVAYRQDFAGLLSCIDIVHTEVRRTPQLYMDGQFPAARPTNEAPSVACAAHDPTPSVGTDPGAAQLYIDIAGASASAIGLSPDPHWDNVNNPWASTTTMAGSMLSFTSNIQLGATLLGLFSDGSMDPGFGQFATYGAAPTLWTHPGTGDVWAFTGNGATFGVGPPDAMGFNLSSGDVVTWPGSGRPFFYQWPTMHPDGGFWSTSSSDSGTIYYHGPLGTHHASGPVRPLRILHIRANGNVIVQEPFLAAGEWRVTQSGIQRLGAFTCTIRFADSPAQVSPDGQTSTIFVIEPGTTDWVWYQSPIV